MCMDFNRRILPYYMTYPGMGGFKQDDNVIRDMEYLQQMYPKEVKCYQRRIVEILDKMDYEGSMIYDEYPDYCCLLHLSKSILRIIKMEEDKEKKDTPTPPEKWVWMENLIQVLLYMEVYKRRHGGRRGFIKF